MSIRIVATPGEKIASPLVGALCIKAGVCAHAAVDPEALRLSAAPLSYFAELCLGIAGIQHDRYGPSEQLFEAAFAMDGHWGMAHTQVRADGGALNRPGSFPNLLSALASKVLDAGVAQAETTYKEWTGRLAQDLPDFKPAPIVAKGQYGELDEVLDGQPSSEQNLGEEMLSQIQFASAKKADDLANMAWAINEDHSLEYVRSVTEALEAALKRGGSNKALQRSEVLKQLDRIAEKLSRGEKYRFPE